MSKLKDIIAKGNKARFIRYANETLWYEVRYAVAEDRTIDSASYKAWSHNVFEFPVPASDITGNSVFLAEDTAMLFMRYIRKHLEMLEEARKVQGGV